MSFSNPITGGQGALIRPAIKSPNFLTGVSGWIIRRDGSAEFNGVIFRGDLQSSNYVPGGIGWKLFYNTGAAEISDLICRGNGGLAQYLHLGETADSAYDAAIEFIGPELPATIVPARIAFWELPGFFKQLVLESAIQAGANPGNVRLSVSSTNDYTVNPPGIFVASLYGGPARFATDSATDTVLGASLTAEKAVILNNNPAYDTTIGGKVIAAKMRGAQANTSTGESTTSVTFVPMGLNLTIPYPASGAIFLAMNALLGNNTTPASALMGFEIRDTDGTGTVRLAAGGNRYIVHPNTDITSYGWSRVISGLPTSGNMFVQLMKASSVVTNTAAYDNMHLSVIPLP